MADENQLGAEGAAEETMQPPAEVTDTSAAPEVQEEGAPADKKGQPRGTDGKFKGDRTSAAPAKRKFKFKVDGRDEETELSDDEIARELSLARGAHKRMWQAAQERKALEAAQKAMAGDPKALREYLRKQHGDPMKAHKLLVAAMKEEIAEMNLDPRDRKIAELEAERQAREAAEQEAKDKAEQERINAEVKEQVDKVRERFVKELTGLLEKVQVPGKGSERVLALAAELYMENRTSGANLPPEQLAEAIRDETVGLVLDITEEWSAEEWEKNDPKTYRKIVAHAAGRVRERQAGASGTQQVRREGPAVRQKGDAPESAGAYGVIPPKKPLSRAEEKAIYGL